MENLLTLEDLLKITWTSLSNPVSLAAFTILFMQIIGKNIVELLRAGILKYILKREVEPVIDGAEDWSLRSILFNMMALSFTTVVAVLQVSETFVRGDAFVLAIVSTAFAISGYEVVKNVLKVGGVQLITQGYKWH